MTLFEVERQTTESPLPIFGLIYGTGNASSSTKIRCSNLDTRDTSKPRKKRSSTSRGVHDLDPSEDEVEAFMQGWRELSPFDDCLPALRRMSQHYKLVALSNGNPWFLDHLVTQRIKFDFDGVISVEDVGAFKPHPGVYRNAARRLEMEPGELIMVSANSYDVLGARTCGLRGIYVNRYKLPYEDTDARYKPDLTVQDFTAMADHLLAE